MNETEKVGPYLGRIQAQHRQLHTLVREIMATLTERPNLPLGACREGLLRQLYELRTYLSAHFVEEESGGCMEEALSLTPALAHEATRLEHQHTNLLAQLDRLIDQLGRRAATVESWAECAADFAHFRHVLLAHEAAENKLLSRGFNAELDVE